MRASLLAGALAVGVLLPAAATGAPDRASLFKTRRLEARAALQAMRHSAPVTVRWQAHRTRPALLQGLHERAQGPTAAAKARSFLQRHPALFVPTDDLVTVETLSGKGLTVVRFQQRYRGLTVEGTTVSVSLDTTGRVRAVRSDVEPIPTGTSITPRITAAAASRAAAHALGLPSPAPVSRPARLVILPGATPRLAHVVLLAARFGVVHYIDADNGRYLGARQLLHGRPGKGVRR
jgi:Zn-dependent metalloprotease